MNEIYFKVLDDQFCSCNGGSAEWEYRVWQPEIANIKPCMHGYHLCRPADLVYWLGPRICLAEGRGERIEDNDKVVFSQARRLRWLRGWNERTARLFACECAERMLPIFEEYDPTDRRPRRAIEVARLYTEGKATKEEMDAAGAAAGAAAGTAAGTAAWTAAGTAEKVWQTKRLMEILGFCPLPDAEGETG